MARNFLRIDRCKRENSVSVPGGTIGESNRRGGPGAFIGTLIPALCVFFIGYPLGRATIKTMLTGWFLILVAVSQFILRNHFQRAGTAVRVTTAPMRSTEIGSYQ